jgi:signal peptidase I
MKKVIFAIFASVFTIISTAQQLPTYPATFFRFPTDMMAPDVPLGALLVIEPMTKEVERGDIIAYQLVGSKSQLIKRVVAISGDRVEKTEEGLKINGVIQPGFERNTALESSVFFGVNEFPSLGQSIIVGSESLYALSNSADDLLDSRSKGTIAVKQVLGRAILWRDVLQVVGWPKVFLSNSIANIKGLLPKEIEEGFVLVDISIKGDRTLHSTIRLKNKVDDTVLAKTVEQIKQNRKVSYCQGSFEPKTFGVSASYSVFSAANQSITDFEFSPKDCQ